MMYFFVKQNYVPEYELTDYSDTLQNVLRAMIDWGTTHRFKIKNEAEKKRLGTLIKQ